MKTKWCANCKFSVDLRKKESFKISKKLCIDIKNNEYHYICSRECEYEYFNK